MRPLLGKGSSSLIRSHKVSPLFFFHFQALCFGVLADWAFTGLLILYIQLLSISSMPLNRAQKVSISRAQSPPTCPCLGCCPHQKHYARGRINNGCINTVVYHRERILKSSTLSCNEEKEEITKPPTR